MNCVAKFLITLLFVSAYSYTYAQQHTFALDFDNGRETNDRARAIAADSNGIDVITLTTCTFGEFGACSGPTRINNEGEIQYHKLYRYNLMSSFKFSYSSEGNMLIPGQRQFIGEVATATFTILTSEGDSVLMRNYFMDAASSVAHTAYELKDALYLIQGSVVSNEPHVSSPFILILDSLGNVVEEHIYTGVVSQAVWGGMTPLSTGEWMMHYIARPIGNHPPWMEFAVLIKLSADFKVIWTKHYHRNSLDQPVYLFELPEDRYLMVSNVDTFVAVGGRGNVAVHILDTAGHVLEDYRLYQGNSVAELFAVIPDGQGHFIGVGARLTDVPDHPSQEFLPWLVRFNDKAEKLWEYQFVWNDPFQSFWAEDVTVLPDGRVAFCGHVRVEPGTPGDSYVIVVDSTGCLRPDKGCPDYVQWVVEPTSTESVAEAPPALEVWPNPASSEVHIRWDIPDVALYSLYDMQGRLLHQASAHTAGETMSLSVGVYPAGMYLIRAVSERGISIEKTLMLTR